MEATYLDTPGDIDLSEDNADIDSGLVAWWLCLPSRMGGTLWYDLVSGRVGTLTNIALNPTSTSGWGFGNRPGGNGELRFDGTNDYVNIPSALSNLSGNNDTFSTWIKLNAYDASGSIVFGTNTTNSVFWQIASNTLIYFDLSNFVTIPSTTFADSIWRLFTATYDGTTARVYVDGVLKASGTFTRTAFASGPKNFALGDWIGSLGSNWTCNGALDDVRIYNRALSAQEILVLYQRSRTGYLNLFEDSLLDYAIAAQAAEGVVTDPALLHYNAPPNQLLPWHQRMVPF